MHVLKNESKYLGLLNYIWQYGRLTDDRTGTGTRSTFGLQEKYDLVHEFPLITTKKIFWKAVVMELLWILQGQTNVQWLQERRVTIWDEWANENGDLGPVYGHQWVHWEKINKKDTMIYTPLNMESGEQGSPKTYYAIEEVNQIKNLIDRIKKNPECRRLIVSAWNVGDLPEMALAPCHAFFQFKVYDKELECQLYQRSADMILGVPFNIPSYALLTHLIAAECGLKATKFIHTFGDAHIYLNHEEAMNTQLLRTPKLPPTLEVKLPEGGLMKFIEDSKTMTWEQIQEVIILKDYDAHPSIKAPVAV